MANPKTIRILLVEDDLEDDQFLRDAIGEIVEAPNWPNWHTCELIPADSLLEALDYLKRETFDVILLNLSLPDGDTLLGNFDRIQAASNSRPIVVLADCEDENLAHTLLRDGAQDVLLKSAIDCAELARALRYAIERQRKVQALESVTFLDDLTGLYNERGFAAMAGHEMESMRRRGESTLVAVIELRATREDELTMVRAGELLRTRMGDNAIIARMDKTHFALCTTTLTEGGVECMSHQFELDLKIATVRVGMATCPPDHPGCLSDLLAEAESHLSPGLAMLAH